MISYFSAFSKLQFSKFSLDSLVINVAMIIEAVLDLDEMNSKMSLQMDLKISWQDPRLRFHRMQESIANPIGEKVKKKLWVPTIIIANANEKTNLALDVDSTSEGNILLIKNVTGRNAPLHQLYNSREFSGSQGYA